MRDDAQILKCPVCGVRFRGSPACSRCGTDLAPLMRLAAHAQRLRLAARHALENEDWPEALRLWREAQSLHRIA